MEKNAHLLVGLVRAAGVADLALEIIVILLDKVLQKKY